jgi:hypothetical protein
VKKTAGHCPRLLRRLLALGYCDIDEAPPAAVGRRLLLVLAVLTLLKTGKTAASRIVLT